MLWKQLYNLLIWQCCNINEKVGIDKEKKQTCVQTYSIIFIYKKRTLQKEKNTKTSQKHKKSGGRCLCVCCCLLFYCVGVWWNHENWLVSLFLSLLLLAFLTVLNLRGVEIEYPLFKGDPEFVLPVTHWSFAATVTHQSRGFLQPRTKIKARHNNSDPSFLLQGHWSGELDTSWAQRWSETSTALA